MKIEEYDDSKDINAWLERFEFVLTAKKITLQALKRAELCATVGGTTFNMLRDLVAPASISDCSYESLIEMLQKREDQEQIQCPIYIQQKKQKVQRTIQ